MRLLEESANGYLRGNDHRSKNVVGNSNEARSAERGKRDKSTPTVIDVYGFCLVDNPPMEADTDMYSNKIP